MRRGIMFLVAFICLASNVSAISVVSDYLVNNTIHLYPGESTLYSIRLQNPTDEETAVHLDYDRQIIQIKDYREVYTLAPQTAGFKIIFNVTAPLQIGKYNIGYTVSEIEPSGGGLPIRLKINKQFNLEIVEKPKPKFSGMWIPLILIVLMGALLAKKIMFKRPSRHASGKRGR